MLLIKWQNVHCHRRLTVRAAPPRPGQILVHESNGQYGRLSPAEAQMAAAAAAEVGGRRFLLAEPAPLPAAPGERAYMVVGFEVVACSIARKAGAPLAPLSCSDGAAPQVRGRRAPLQGHRHGTRANNHCTSSDCTAFQTAF